MHCYEKELSLFKFQLMTSGCRCAEKDLCQTALMRSKTVIQFRAAVSWRRRIIKLRFADANRGIMGQLCKSLPIWKWTKKAQNCTFPYFFASRKHSHPEKNDKKKTRFGQVAYRRVDLQQVQENTPCHFHEPIDWTRTAAGPVFTIWGRFIIP